MHDGLNYYGIIGVVTLVLIVLIFFKVFGIV
jgi:hypothetical protein